MRTYENRELKIWENEALISFPINSRILDIGCGKGREAFCLNDRGFRVTGIDISETVVNEAKKSAILHNVDICFSVSDDKNLPFGDKMFDIVIIWAQTFGLFGKNDRNRILNECRRVLGQNGILSVSVHDRELLREKYAEFIKNDCFFPFPDTDPGLYYKMYTMEDLKNCAEEMGFKDIECKKGKIYNPKDNGWVLHCECKK